MKPHQASRTAVLVLTAATTGFGVYACAVTAAWDGFGALDGALVMVFGALCAWVAFWFWLNLLGVVHMLRARGAPRTLSLGSTPSADRLPPTIVLMPIYNEDVTEVFGRLRAMIRSVAATGEGRSIDFFVLSDSTNAEQWLQEELAWAALRAESLDGPAVFYRRRATKFRKKSGNVAAFCERWGGRYRYMVVLDADSVMDGKTIVELVRRMEAAPTLGILQAPSLLAMRHSLFGRLQQFAGSVYGPPLFAGLSWFFQSSGNYWGHNAIVRVEPFVRHCGLPALSGAPPFGGPILSHDFVEAALMRRAGYGVRLAWDLSAGSFEQGPASLAASAARDRRWCQGNLQHLRLMLSPTFDVKDKAHFVIGVFFYGASVLWGLYALLCGWLFLTAEASPSRAEHALASHVLLVAATAGLLFGGKALSVGLSASDPEKRALHGGSSKLLSSAAIEMVLTALAAPVTMLSHVACVASVLFGISVDWNAAQRGEARSPWREASRGHAGHTAIGLGVALVAFSTSPILAVWSSPLWGAWLLSIPLGALLASTECGRILRRAGLLSSPTETRPDKVIEDATSTRPPVGGQTFADDFLRFVRDPWLNTLHVALVSELALPSRPETVMQGLVDRVCRYGPASLDPRERIVVLSDASAMRLLHERYTGNRPSRSWPPRNRAA